MNRSEPTSDTTNHYGKNHRNRQPERRGWGKTTTSINLAASLATLEKKVLLVDCDPQANASSGIGVDVGKIESSVYESMIGKQDIRENIYTTDIDGLDVVPSHVNLSGADVELLQMERREFVIKEMLAVVKDDYDYILIDCSPSLGLTTVNALTAADSVIIPCSANISPSKASRSCSTRFA